MCLFYLNETESAARLLDEVLEQVPGMGPAMHVRAQLRTQRPEANHVEDLRRRLRRTELAPNDRILAHFALAKELEDIGAYADSFAVLEDGEPAEARHAAVRHTRRSRRPCRTS